MLDPALIERSAPRAGFARALLAHRPTAIRLNAAEFAALTGAAADDVTLSRCAVDHRIVVALTGATDVVSADTRRMAIANGDPRMAKVTAVGCAASALVAACLAVETDAWTATAAGLLLIAVAGEVAGKTARGPGSLGVGIIDALYELDRATLLAHARVT